MSEPERHHFLPQFYLKRWDNSEGKIETYSRRRGQIHIKSYVAKGVAYERGLYSLEGAPAKKRNSIEREFMGPVVDDPAAKALRLMLREDEGEFTIERRVAWTRFLMSLLVRLPPLLSKIEADGDAALISEMERAPEEYEALRKPGDPLTPQEFLSVRGLDWVLNNFGRSLIPGLIENPRMTKDIAHMHWIVLRYGAGPYGFVTSDFPICMHPGLAHQNCLISLPLSPTALFLAAHDVELLNQLRALPPATVINAANKIVIKSAERFVYADDRQYRGLVDTYLRPEPPRQTSGPTSVHSC